MEREEWVREYMRKRRADPEFRRKENEGQMRRYYKNHEENKKKRLDWEHRAKMRDPIGYAKKRREAMKKTMQRPEYKKRQREYMKEWYGKFRVVQSIHKKAQDRVSYCLEVGILTKEPCVICGEVNVHGHHHSYDKINRGSVIWLCPIHHKAAHALERVEFDCRVDAEAYIREKLTDNAPASHVGPLSAESDIEGHPAADR